MSHAMDHQNTHSDRLDVDPTYRGFKFGAAFFGWLVAVALSVLLAGLVAVIATAVGANLTVSRSELEAEAGTIGIASGTALVVLMAVAYFAGGYVAGRMARFDGMRQGLGVWVIGLLVTVLVGVVGAAAGSEYDLFSRADLPSVPLSGDTLTTGGVVAAVALVVLTLVAAILGGKAGERYHRKVDRSTHLV